MSSPKVTLYAQPSFQVDGRPRCMSGSPFVIKVARILQWKHVDFELDEIDWLEMGERVPQLTSTRKLPILDYGSERLEDSTEIAHFLESRHPAPPLFPLDPLDRARGHFIEEWADDVLYWYGLYEQRRITQGDIGGTAYYRDLPEEVREQFAARSATGGDEKLFHQGIGRYSVAKVQSDIRRGLDALEAVIQADGYAAGRMLSISDIAVFAQLDRRLAGTNPWLEGEVAARLTLSDWFQRVDEETSRDVGSGE